MGEKRPDTCPECGGMVFEDNKRTWFCVTCDWTLSKEERENKVPVSVLNSDQEVLLVMKNAIEVAEKRLRELVPKGRFADVITGDEKRTYSMSESAKVLEKITGMGRNKLIQWLRDQGFLLASRGYWGLPAEWAIKRGYVEVGEKVTPVGIVPAPRLTGKGLLWVEKKWHDRNN